ncbi:MAG: glucosaminidase domain-containing protein [Bacteroidales bacterium]|nr:glucosaminidase domain-containing protein [Bacteroidales bacterium]
MLLSGDKSPQEQYIEKYASIAVEEMHRTGVPASITLAQGLLESGAGLSTLAKDSNNHFGIKCHSDWKGKTTTKTDNAPNECFRVYDSASDSFRDHSDFLRYNDRYKFLFDYPVTDYKAWAAGLRQAGYATDPGYSIKLITLIEHYSLNSYDVVEKDSEPLPEAPLIIETPKKVETSEYGTTETVSIRFNRLFQLNSVQFVYALPGETYRSIADHYGLSLHSILSFNDLEKDEQLLPGSVVYIDMKKNKAEKGLDKYIVGTEGESLRDICQRFAVRMKSVMKLNGFEKDCILREGDTVLLR